MADEAAALARRLKAFFVASRLAGSCRARASRDDVAQPIFIVGFPRSGTTMIEQTLTRASRISAGDELPSINELTGLHAAHAGEPAGYPDALAELWLGDRLEGLDKLRDYYLQRARQLGALQRGGRVVHRQDAAQRDASRPHRPGLPRGADHPCRPPSARRRALRLLQSSHARLLLRLRPEEHCAALRAGDGPRRALSPRDGSALSAGALRGRGRRSGGEGARLLDFVGAPSIPAASPSTRTTDMRARRAMPR